jgi:osmotically-inducible protein OsmY
MYRCAIWRRQTLVGKGASTPEERMDTSTAMVGKAAQALRSNSNPMLRQLSVEETPEVVILTGRVSSYYAKQLAQETVMPYLGQRQLVNRIVVVPLPKR